MKSLELGDFLENANMRHNGKYDYSKVVYINNYTKVEILCPIHGIFWQTPKNHYRSGCKLCADVAKSNDHFLDEAVFIHGDKYNYSKVIYSNQLTPITIICPTHGEFEQLPKVHLNGSGCRKCYDDKPKANQKSLEDFISRSVTIHSGKYDYSKSEYVHNKYPIIIICRKHGEFLQTPNSHLRGTGCPECYGNKKLTSAQFISRASVVHDNKYDYSIVNYLNCYSKIQIICPQHGIFTQVAQDHLSGHGCYKCYKNISKMETNWLNSLGVPDDQEHRNVYLSSAHRKYKVDGYHDGVIYEFYGDFWHGNPCVFKPSKINLANKISFGDLYRDTLKREVELIKLGYKVVSIWEHEWKALNETK